MGTYDFTTLPERFSTNATKWQETVKDPEVLPLWIADMDFQVFSEMTQALEAFAKRSVFGYDSPKPSLYQAILDWEANEHGYRFDKEALILIEGVVPAISVAIQAFTKENDAVMINTPVYPPFARTVKLNKRQLVTNSLQEIDDRFEIDFEQLEKDIVDNDVKLFAFCSPHNPGGRVWSIVDLQKVGDICQKHGVILISDEIHQDMALFGNKHHSFNTVSENFKNFTIILASATKTFNIAGTKNSFAIIENEGLRQQFKERQLTNNQHEISSLGLVATEVALTKGKPWLEELKPLIERHISYVYHQLTEKTKIKVMQPQGTYLIWLDFSAYGLDHKALQEKIRYEAKLVLNDGLTFGEEGRNHARFNVAAPTTIIEEAVKRLVDVFGK